MKYYILALISALLALCTYIYPMEGDDFIYSFTLSATNYRVVDLAGVLEGTANCFHYINGRTLVNFLIFLFVNLIPQWGMFLFAFLTFFLTLKLLTPNHAQRLTTPQASNPAQLLTPSILFLLFCPDIYDTLMWKTGFMNYALPGMLNLLFLHHLTSLTQPKAPNPAPAPNHAQRLTLLTALVSRRQQNFSLFTFHFSLLFSFLTASLHEGISLPISGGLIIYLILNFRNITTEQYAAIIPYLLGTLLILLTPGTSARVGLTSSHTFHLLPFLQGLLHNAPSLITTLILFLLLWHNRKQTHPILYFLQNTVTLSAILLSLLLFLLLSITTGTPEPRYFYFTHILSLSLLTPYLAQRLTTPQASNLAQPLTQPQAPNQVSASNPAQLLTQPQAPNQASASNPAQLLTQPQAPNQASASNPAPAPNLAQRLTSITALASRRQQNFSLFTLHFSLFLLLSYFLFQTYQKRTIAEKEFHLFATTTDYVVPSDFTDLTSDTTLYSNQLIAKYFNKPYLIAYPSPIYYHLYLHEDAPQSSFSPEWLQLTPSLFARKITPSNHAQRLTQPQAPNRAQRLTHPQAPNRAQRLTQPQAPNRAQRLTQPQAPNHAQRLTHPQAPNRAQRLTQPQAPNHAQRLTLIYTFPLLNIIQRHTQVTPQIIRSKQGTLYQVVSTHSSFTKITNIE